MSTNPTGDTAGGEQNPGATRQRDSPGPGSGGGGGDGIEGTYEVPEWLSLDPDEEVVWVGEPALASLAGTVITGIVTIPLLIGILILLAAPVSYLSIKNTDFVVTTKSLYVKQGVVSTNIETVDLDKIQNTEYSQSFWGKQLGFGNIEVSTAGSSGSDVTFRAIENARAVRDRISELGAQAGGRSDDGTDRADSGQLDDLVAELRATREALERIERKMSDDAGDERDETEQATRGDGTTDAQTGNPQSGQPSDRTEAHADETQWSGQQDGGTDPTADDARRSGQRDGRPDSETDDTEWSG